MKRNGLIEMFGITCKIHVVLTDCWPKPEIAVSFVWVSVLYQLSTRYQATFVGTTCVLFHKLFTFQVAFKYSDSGTLL
jgi:hypothetical protein